MKERDNSNVTFVMLSLEKRAIGISKHVSTVHEGKKQKCDICNADFKSKQGMKGHIATLHGGKRNK